MPMTSVLEERHEQQHFFNRSYISVNTNPADQSPFPYSNFSAIPRYASRLDDYASRFSTSKLSPASHASDDGYGSSSASSTFASYHPRRDLESPPEKSTAQWKPVPIARCNAKHPVANGTNALSSANKTMPVQADLDHPRRPTNADVESNALKNVKSSVAEVEERDRQEWDRAQAAMTPRLPGCSPLPEEKIRLSDGIVRLQAGTNKYDSQKGMTGFGTARRETTKMVDTKHPEYDHEKPDQSEIPLQSGTNKFASQKGMTGFGTNRRETCKIVDTAHPEYNPESSIDSTQIPYQMGSNQYASQKGMTGFGQPRWEVLDPSISWQNRKSQGMVRLQSGTNRFASQSGMIGFGTIRNTTYLAESGELPYEDMKKSEAIIPSQAGWNKGDSQKRMTSFGTPRDVRGKHLKRIWELEYPEEAEVSLDRL